MASNSTYDMVPMLTVLKNNVTRKNIFITKNIMLFGRHPQCDVLLKNPSVSCFHFGIYSHPPSRSLKIKDLISTHGTWLNGKRIATGELIDIKDGDALKVGQSTRVYILSWITPPQPFDPHNPIVFDFEQEVDQVLTQEQQERLDMWMNRSFPSEQIQPEPDSNPKQNVGKKTLLQKDTNPFEVLNGLFVTETSHFVTKFDSGNSKPCDCGNRVLSPPCLQSVDEVENLEKIEACPEAEMAVETNLFCTLREYLTHNICLPVVEAVQGIKLQQFQRSFDEKGAAADSDMPKESEFGCSLRDSDGVEYISADGARIFNSDESKSLLVGEVILDSRLQQIEITEDAAVDSVSDEVTFNVKDFFGNKCSCIKYVNPVFDGKGVASVNLMPTESEHTCTFRDNDKIEDILTVGARNDNSENTSLPAEEDVPVTKSQQLENADEVAVDSISDEEKQEIYLSEESQSNMQAISKATSEKVNQTSQSLVFATGFSEMETFESCVKATDRSLAFVDVCLRRGKAASSPQVRTRKSRFMSTSIFDTEVEMRYEKENINKSIPKYLFSVLDDEEVLTPNKENLSPNMRKKSKLKEIKHSKSQWSHDSEANFSPNTYSDERISSFSNKENQAPKVVQEWKPIRNSAEKQYTTESKKNRVERVPLQPLTNSGSKRKSGGSRPVVAAKRIDAHNCGQILEKHTKPSRIIGEEQKRSWDMVVDTSSLLNKESRKALQLLQGLKGTRLIIPRLVIRELDSMKRQFKFFRRNSEASLALEWIKECTVNTKSWIHIQSSMDESRLVASTPLASPESFVDHILDCALLYRRMENNRQLILLSQDITLKIEAMAEGLLCETVPEFHRSLVNPFSDRFMWASSSPRGLTWSCQDDVVLREKYCSLPSQAGLKLITEQFLY